MLTKANANVPVTSPQLDPPPVPLPLLSFLLLLLFPPEPQPPLAIPPIGLVKAATTINPTTKHKSNPIRMAFIAKKPTFTNIDIRVAIMV